MSAIVEVVFEGFGPGVEAQSVACIDVAHHSACHPERSDAEHRVARAPEGIEGQRKYTLKATFPPSEFERIAREINGEALAYPSLGVIYFNCPSLERAQTLRATFESLGGTLVVQDMPAEWRGKIDAWGMPPPAFKLMRALKERFDPGYRLNPGRFVGGL